jgi:LmeA-like phospholipid-binding
MPDERRLEEQALSKAVEVGLSSQLDEAKKINVDINTDLLKIVQGQVDGVSVTGEGLVMQKDIRVQELQLQTDKVDINPFSALFGEIKLNSAVNAVARIVLKEADINRALSSEYVLRKMPTYDLNVNGEIVRFDLQKIEMFLPGDGLVKCNGMLLLHELGNSRQVSFTALIRPRTQHHPTMLQGFVCTDGDGFSLDLVAEFMKKIKELLHSPYFELEDMALRVREMQVGEGELTLLADAHVRQIPSV